MEGRICESRMKEVLQIQDLKNITFYIIILKRLLEKLLHKNQGAQLLAREHGIQDLRDTNKREQEEYSQCW